MSGFFKDIFLGIATDDPEPKNKPEQPEFAINDVVYYVAPGENRGRTATVTGYSRDDNGRLKVSVEIIATGEVVTTTQRYIRQ